MPEREADVGNIEGVVTDQATGKHLAFAQLFFGRDAVEGSITDFDGYYFQPLPARATTAAIVYEDKWMVADPVEVAPNTMTRRDFTFVAKRCSDRGVRSEDTDADRLAEVALTELDKTPWLKLLVDKRRAADAHMLSVVGFEVTTRDELQFEANKRHQRIDFTTIDVELDGACATATVGWDFVTPGRSELAHDDDCVKWLYIKEPWGWRRAAQLRPSPLQLPKVTCHS